MLDLNTKLLFSFKYKKCGNSSQVGAKQLPSCLALRDGCKVGTEINVSEVDIVEVKPSMCAVLSGTCITVLKRTMSKQDSYSLQFTLIVNYTFSL